MSNARDAIRKRIERRVKKIQENREKNTGNATPKKICRNALEEMSNELPLSSDHLDFHSRLNFYVNKLHNKLLSIDPKVKIELEWNGDPEEGWDNISIKGLRVEWSIVYMAHHMKEDRVMYVGLSDFLLEDICDLT